jgi:hypothetical protein
MWILFLPQAQPMWDVRGVINSGTINYNSFTTFTSSGAVDNDGWNLVGNPYPSTIDWDAATGWTRTGLTNAIYMRDNGLSSPQFATYVGGVGTLGGSRYIPTGQAYWVKSNGGPINFQSTEAVKVAGQQTTFFREGAPDDMVRVTLQKGNVKDEAVIRFVETATSEFDNEWDAYKLLNATFNLSSISSNSKYAINALSKLECTSAIQLDISNATPGTYDLLFTEYESFVNPTELVLVDQFLNEEIDVKQLTSYTFEITTDPKSAGNRFTLRIAMPDVNKSIPVSGLETLCIGSEYSVNLTASENGVKYFASLNNSPISETAIGTGAALQLNVNEALMAMGSNTIQVMAQRASCDMVMLTESVEVKVDKMYDVQSVTDGLSCQPGSVTLKASGAPAEGMYRWYDSVEATTPVKETAENQVTTPVLNKSQTYYVSIVNSIGCEGARKEVKAEVVTYDNVEVTAPQYGVLTSSYAAGNTWYYNDELIAGATGQSISIDKSGVYRVEVAIGGCKTTDTFEFTITAVEDVFGSVSMYPNPVENELTIQLAGKEVKALQVLSTQGSVMFSEEMNGRNSITVDTRSYTSGLYLVRIIGLNNSVSTQKILKK